MATAGVMNNIEAVREAIRLYGERVKNDSHKQIQKKMGDIAYRASEATPYGDKDRLRNEISNLPITKDGGRKRYGNTQYVGQYKLMNWERKLKGLPTLGNSKFKKVKSYVTRPGSMVAEERITKRRTQNRLAGLGVTSNIYAMDGKYKRFIQARIRSIKFIRAAWGVAAAFFGKPFDRGDFGPDALARFSGKQYGGGEIEKIGDNLTQYSIFNGAGRFDTRRKKPGQETAPQRPSADQARAESIITKALQRGVDFVLADIIKYFEDRAKRFQKEIRILNKFK
jgi:hypothetical protein